jgi:hypothetical protein
LAATFVEAVTIYIAPMPPIWLLTTGILSLSRYSDGLHASTYGKADGLKEQADSQTRLFDDLYDATSDDS